MEQSREYRSKPVYMANWSLTREPSIHNGERQFFKLMVGKLNVLYVKLLQSCLTHCNSMDCSPPGSSVHEDFPGKNTGGGCHALLQGNLPNPGIKPRKPNDTEVGSLSLLQGIFPTQEWNRGLLHCRWILYQLRYQGSPSVCPRTF